jgi:hypothetical protein
MTDHTYYKLASLDWSRRWPVEALWAVRKRAA